MAKFSVQDCSPVGATPEKEIELYLCNVNGALYLMARDKNTKTPLLAPYVLQLVTEGGKLRVNRHGGVSSDYFHTTTDGYAKIVVG